MVKTNVNKNLKKLFENKDILVTGGCGSIGSELVLQLLKFNPTRIRVFDNDEAGHFRLNQKTNNSTKIRNLIGCIRDRDRVFRALEGVDIVFHAAALKHVPLCEYNPFEAVSTNVIGTQNLVEGAIEKNIKYVVSISTDKAVNPINTMGATKLLSEKIVVNAPVGTSSSKLSCVRFGNVLASVGSVMPIFENQISKGGPVTITSKKMTRFFMTIADAVSLILQVPLIMKGREVFVLKMDALKIIDLAEVMIEELSPKYGFDPKRIKLVEIGTRHGEKLDEALFTKEESPFITDTGKLFILRNSVAIKPLITNLNNHLDYDSGNIDLLSKEQIRKLLYEKKIIVK